MHTFMHNFTSLGCQSFGEHYTLQHPDAAGSTLLVDLARQIQESRTRSNCSSHYVIISVVGWIYLCLEVRIVYFSCKMF